MQKKIPQRQCMGCRERKAKRELIRVVRSPEGEETLSGPEWPTAGWSGPGTGRCKRPSAPKRWIAVWK